MFSFIKRIFGNYKKNNFDKNNQHLLREILSFEYEIFEDSLIIYKEFTSKDLLNFYKHLDTTDKYAVAEYVKDYVYSLNILKNNEAENKNLQHLIGITLLKNLDKKNDELLNEEKIDNEFDLDIKYFKENKHKLDKLIKDFTTNKHKVARELGVI